MAIDHQGQAAMLGAHEVMEAHEALCGSINAINSFDLYEPHIRDPQLRDIVNRHRDFTFHEYDSMVNLLQRRGIQPAPVYGNIRERGFEPRYGLRHPAPESPGGSISDKDIASGVLAIHKCSATKLMTGALECAEPQLRQAMIRSASNCADQAYEVFQLMNERGWYQVPTLQPNTTQTIVGRYRPVQGRPSPGPGIDRREPASWRVPTGVQSGPAEWRVPAGGPQSTVRGPVGGVGMVGGISTSPSGVGNQPTDWRRPVGGPSASPTSGPGGVPQPGRPWDDQSD